MASTNLIKQYNGTRKPTFATVFVGPRREKFTIQEGILICRSPYFCAALTGGFKEAQDKTIRLEEDDCKNFEFFAPWLYHGRFASNEDSAELYAAWTFIEDGDVKTENLKQLYVFCGTGDVPG